VLCVVCCVLCVVCGSGHRRVIVVKLNPPHSLSFSLSLSVLSPLRIFSAAATDGIERARYGMWHVARCCVVYRCGLVANSLPVSPNPPLRQLVSLSMMLLNENYRTLRYFSIHCTPPPPNSRVARGSCAASSSSSSRCRRVRNKGVHGAAGQGVDQFRAQIRGAHGPRPSQLRTRPTRYTHTHTHNRVRPLSRVADLPLTRRATRHATPGPIFLQFIDACIQLLQQVPCPLHHRSSFFSAASGVVW
jgi:hypothetical protein